MKEYSIHVRRRADRGPFNNTFRMFPPTVHLISNTIVNPRSHPLRVRAGGDVRRPCQGLRPLALPHTGASHAAAEDGGWCGMEIGPEAERPDCRLSRRARGDELPRRDRGPVRGGPIERGNAKEW